MPTVGIHKAIVKEHWFTTSQGGNPGLAVKVGIAGDWDDEEIMIGTIWLTPKSMGMARIQLRALGFDCDTQDLADLNDAISLVGHEVDVEIKEETYNNRTEMRIARFGGPAPKPTAEKLGEATKALRAAKSQPKAKKAKEPYPDINAQLQETKTDSAPWDTDDVP